MIRIGRAAFALAGLAAAALASQSVIELGDAHVRYDDTRWTAAERPGRIELTPIGKVARKLDPVHVRVIEASNSCTELALQAFAIGHYETAGLAPTPIGVGGIKGERFEAHTGCRNATPRGVVICVKTGGKAYLLQSVNVGCEGRNLFSGIDPLAEIAEGLTFSDGR